MKYSCHAESGCHCASASRVVPVALAVLLVCAAPRARSSDDARIVFGGATDGAERSIYETTPDGAWFEERTAGNDATYPAWSHDGRAIALSYRPAGGGFHIYIMDAWGDNLSLVSKGPDDARPTWSPHGDAIAFTSTRPGADNQGIYVVDLAGGGEARLTDLDAFAKYPSWRPVGDAIAYMSNSAGFADIHVMDSRGEHLTQLTDREG